MSPWLLGMVAVWPTAWFLSTWMASSNLSSILFCLKDRTEKRVCVTAAEASSLLQLSALKPGWWQPPSEAGEGRNNPPARSLPPPKSTRCHTSGTAQEREAETSQTRLWLGQTHRAVTRGGCKAAPRPVRLWAPGGSTQLCSATSNQTSTSLTDHPPAAPGAQGRRSAARSGRRRDGREKEKADLLATLTKVWRLPS